MKKLGFRHIPDVDGLREFCQRKMCWANEETDVHLLPILKTLQDTPLKNNIKFYFEKKPS